MLETQDCKALPGAQEHPGPDRGIWEPTGAGSAERRHPQPQLALPPAPFRITGLFIELQTYLTNLLPRYVRLNL